MIMKKVNKTKQSKETLRRIAEKNRKAVERRAEAESSQKKVEAQTEESRLRQDRINELARLLSEQQESKNQEIRVQRESLTRVTKKDYKRKRFFVTAAELGAPVNQEFMKTVAGYLKETGAELVILPLKPHRKPTDPETILLDRNLVKAYRKNIHTEYVFNNSIKAIELHLNSQQINPVTGISRLARGDMSIIVGHSKQFLKTIPTGHSSLPKIIHTTGVITNPWYRDNRIGRIADNDHVIGGLILEVVGSQFHIRTVKADKDGSFVDIDRRYSGSKQSKKERAEALVLGDYHAGFEDQQAEKFALELMGVTKPKRIFFHDFFDACSVSHHRDRSISQHLILPESVRRLADELSYGRSILKKWNNEKPQDCELFMVASNHPEHLERYLDEGRFIKDRMNYKKGVELAYKYHVLGLDPIKEGIDPGGKLATWLTRESDIWVEGVMLSAHGDKGLNGARGSARSTEFSYGNAIVGHAHTPEIQHNTYVVGTLSKLKLDYNDGPSGWLHACGLVHRGGGKQLIISIDGQWRMGSSSSKK
jgi:hypothetical protein